MPCIDIECIYRISGFNRYFSIEEVGLIPNVLLVGGFCGERFGLVEFQMYMYHMYRRR
jgi:hypothetical protein